MPAEACYTSIMNKKPIDPNRVAAYVSRIKDGGAMQIVGRPTREYLAALAQLASDPAERARLEARINKPREWTRERRGGQLAAARRRLDHARIDAEAAARELDAARREIPDCAEPNTSPGLFVRLSRARVENARAVAALRRADHKVEAAEAGLGIKSLPLGDIGL